MNKKEEQFHQKIVNYEERKKEKLIPHLIKKLIQLKIKVKYDQKIQKLEETKMAKELIQLLESKFGENLSLLDRRIEPKRLKMFDKVVSDFLREISKIEQRNHSGKEPGE